MLSIFTETVACVFIHLAALVLLLILSITHTAKKQTETGEAFELQNMNPQEMVSPAIMENGQEQYDGKQE